MVAQFVIAHVIIQESLKQKKKSNFWKQTSPASFWSIHLGFKIKFQFASFSFAVVSTKWNQGMLQSFSAVLNE